MTRILELRSESELFHYEETLNLKFFEKHFQHFPLYPWDHELRILSTSCLRLLKAASKTLTYKVSNEQEFTLSLKIYRESVGNLTQTLGLYAFNIKQFIDYYLPRIGGKSCSKAWFTCEQLLPGEGNMSIWIPRSIKINEVRFCWNLD